MLYTAPAPSSRFRNHIRCCPNDNGTSPGRAAATSGIRGPAAPASASSTIWAGDGAVNRSPIPISVSSTARTRAITRMASSESPPSSKKLSSAPTRSTPSTSANRPQTISSAAVRGSRLTTTPPNSGAGSAARSSFPFTVTGSASSTTTAAGTMYSGSRAATNARNAGTSSGAEWPFPPALAVPFPLAGTT